MMISEKFVSICVAILSVAVVAMVIHGKWGPESAAEPDLPAPTELPPGRYQVAGDGRGFLLLDTATGQTWAASISTLAWVEVKHLDDLTEEDLRLRSRR